MDVNNIDEVVTSMRRFQELRVMVDKAKALPDEAQLDLDVPKIGLVTVSRGALLGLLNGQLEGVRSLLSTLHGVHVQG